MCNVKIKIWRQYFSKRYFATDAAFLSSTKTKTCYKVASTKIVKLQKQYSIFFQLENHKPVKLIYDIN